MLITNLDANAFLRCCLETNTASARGSKRRSNASSIGFMSLAPIGARQGSHVSLLPRIAEATVGDPVTIQVRWKIVRAIYYHLSVSPALSPECRRARVDALIRLTELLGDEPWAEKLPSTYRLWKPLVDAGGELKRIGQREEGTCLITQAALIARTIPDLNTRLGQYSFLVFELLRDNDNRSIVLELLREVRANIEESELPMAKKWQQRLPILARNYKLYEGR